MVALAVKAHARLVATNWVRTGAWTGRAILLLLALRDGLG
jgi:hypothetical protein